MNKARKINRLRVSDAAHNVRQWRHKVRDPGYYHTDPEYAAERLHEAMAELARALVACPKQSVPVDIG